MPSNKQKVILKGSYEYITGLPDEWKGFQERNANLKALGIALRKRTSVPGNKDKVVSSLVNVYSDGTRMQATLWKPEAALNAPDGSFPAIVLCQGWGGTRDSLDSGFGRSFAKAGFVCLTFDYRGWNDSDGVITTPHEEPGSHNQQQQEQGRQSDVTHGEGGIVEGLKGRIIRQLVDMDWQTTDIEAALDFIDGEPVVDSKRIGIWGMSQGGGHVVTIGSRHRDRVKAIVANVPSLGDAGAGAPKSRVEEARKEAIARARGLKHSVPQGVEKGHLPGMDGVPNLRKLIRYRPLEGAQHIQCPILVMDAEEEEVFDRKENGLAVYNLVKVKNPQSEYVILPGRHYDAYEDAFQEGATRAIDFFKKHLGIPAPSKL